jgi:hypothetical protein
VHCRPPFAIGYLLKMIKRDTRPCPTTHLELDAVAHLELHLSLVSALIAQLESCRSPDQRGRMVWRADRRVRIAPMAQTDSTMFPGYICTRPEIIIFVRCSAMVRRHHATASFLSQPSISSHTSCERAGPGRAG